MPSYIADSGEHWKARANKWHQDGTRTYTRSFWVKTTSPHVSGLTVALADIIPRRGATYYLSDTGEWDQSACVVDVDPKQRTETPYLWDVTVSYSNKLANDPTWTTDSPLDVPALIRWSTQEIQYGIERDLDERLICNSSFERYTPPLQRTARLLRLDITRNQLEFDPSEATDYLDHVNDASFFGFEADSVKMIQFDGEPQFTGSPYAIDDQDETDPTFYWKVKMAFLIKEIELGDEYRLVAGVPDLVEVIDRWNPLRLPDLGSYGIEAATGNIQLIRDAGGAQPVGAPVRLNGQAVQLDTTVAIATIMAGLDSNQRYDGETVWNLFRIYPSADFSALNI